MRISDWSSDVCSSDLRFLILRLRDAYPRLRRIAGRALAVHVGLRDEAARHQCLGAFEFGLGEIGIGLCDADRGGKACRLLRLDGAIDDRERLTGADPLARLDQDRKSDGEGKSWSVRVDHGGRRKIKKKRKKKK